MVHDIYIAFACACYGSYIAELSGVMQKAAYYLKLKRIKPLDCGPCLSFWVTASYLFSTKQPFGWEYFTITSMSAVIAILIIKIVNR